jgi:predicted O-linked N-acetylglucosamine transferase (SPINDLY family)
LENFAKEVLTLFKTPELVAADTEEYIAKAVKLANNFEKMLDEAVQKTKNKN